MRRFRAVSCALAVRALVGMSVLAIVSAGSASPAEQPAPLEMSFPAPVDKVYAALVQEAGIGLQTTVKDACVVNSRSTRNNVLIFDISATCRDAGNGQTLVVLNIQRDPAGQQIFRIAGEQEKFLHSFWAGVEAWLKANTTAAPGPSEQVAPPPCNDLATVTVKSTPDDAEITVDGKFSGNAPATLRLPPGDHVVRISNKGFKNWERNMTVTSGGTATINATLEPER